MHQDFIQPDPWNLIEEGFNPNSIKAAESLFSLGNGAMGQRANFEEDFSGPTFQGSYIAGVYYPDKTRVGWWKNGYPESFAKVLNAPNWIGIHIEINGHSLDLFKLDTISSFKRVLNMKTGVYTRSFEAVMPDDTKVKVQVERFLSLSQDEVGAINYTITPLNKTATIKWTPYLDGGIKNEDTNWEDTFWDTLWVGSESHQSFIRSRTFKTNFDVCTFMESSFYLNADVIHPEATLKQSEHYIGQAYTIEVPQNLQCTCIKYGGYTTSFNHQEANLITASKLNLRACKEKGYQALKEAHQLEWASIWKQADITIEGDVKAQQGIRFNIFQLNQTYLGKDPRLNIGPKGFTGEKYGGSTYWDTEAYCLPFYMATKSHQVARNLLVYRHNHLPQAIANAQKLGFTNGAALYPMVTMNGEESHNEWEITFEEIHRNGAIAFAIYNYIRYTGDEGYMLEKGLDVLVAIARFWYQRANFSKEKNKYVILGVTGPNEYENNVNNNWYTNYIAKWCIHYAYEQLKTLSVSNPALFSTKKEAYTLSDTELNNWNEVAQNLYMPYCENYQVYLQQDGFLDKELLPVSQLKPEERPLNQHWSWDRILRSPYIKQADVLQGFYFFEDHFSQEELARHFDFYEPFTVHESSLSPCVHAILAASLDRMEQAYAFYLQTARLDLDDYNKEVEEGCHITSMAGTWMSIVEGFGGMRVKNNKLHFAPKIPAQWQSYSFKINFRGQTLHVQVNKESCCFELQGNKPITISVNGVDQSVSPHNALSV